MPIRAARPGRLLDVLAITLFLFVFVGLAVYHYRRLEADAEPIQELVERKFDEPKPIEKKDANYAWPQWRGPLRDGIARESDVLTEWPAGGPKQLWQAELGDAYSSVAVALGRVFTMFQDGPNESVICFEEATGREIWRFSYEAAFTNNYGNGPRATPSVDGKLVYTISATGLMHCLEADTDKAKGKLVWSKDLLKEFGAPLPQWGIAFSPLIEEERIFIMPGGPNGNALAALDKKTGAVLWKKHDDRASYSSPIACTIHGKRQILFLTGARLVSVVPETGEQLWDFPWPMLNEINVATPIVRDAFVFISASYGKGGMVVQVKHENQSWEAIQAYKRPANMRNHFSTSVLLDDHLYGFDDSILVCMHFQTGKIAWKQRDFEKGSVVLVGRQLIIYGSNGLLALAEANPQEYVERARFQFTEQHSACWTVPVLANGRLYVRDLKRLVCYDVKKGS